MILERKKLLALFFRFLKEKNAYIHFKRNVSILYPSFNKQYARALSCAIMNTIYWAETKEGGQYFSSLHFDWMRFCVKNNIVEKS